MKNRTLLFFLLMCLLCTSFVWADDTLPDDIIDVPSEQPSPSPVVVDVTQLLTNLQNITPSNGDGDKDISSPVDKADLMLVNTTSEIKSVRPQDTSGFKAVMLTILGNYDTVVTDYTYQSGSSGYYSHSINIERDWSWLASAAMLGLLVYCTFRAIGGILARA